MVTESGYMPYMEMKSSLGPNPEETEPPGKSTKVQSKQNKDEGYGLSLQLGEEYERKKQKLKEELRLDYRRYVSERQKVNATGPFTQPPTRPLHTSERRYLKDKMEAETFKEYSPLLQGDEEMRKKRNPSNAPQPHGKGQVISPSYHPLFSSKPQGRKSPERLQYSLMPARRDLDAAPRRWQRRFRRENHSSDEALNTEEEEQEELVFLQKRRPKHRTEPALDGRRHRKLHQRANRFTYENSEVAVPGVTEEDHQEENRRTPLTPIKANPQAPAQTRAANKRNMSDFATGLLIGAAERQESVQRRKVRYRQELLEQIAEQHRNKRKEKELELRVAATGAVDPEKELHEKQSMTMSLPGLPQPDRIKQFGSVWREHEGRRRDVPYKPGEGLDTPGADADKRTQKVERAPPDRPRVAFQSPILEYSSALGHLGNAAGTGVGISGAAAFGENFHKDFSGTLAEMVAPRVARVAPPLAPALSEAYNTPYDEAYYYYGARNPLDPNPTYYGPPAAHQSPNLPAGPLTSVLQPPAGVFVQPAPQHGVSSSGVGIGANPDRNQHPRDHAVSYKDALKQQIEEQQERRRREREEKQRYEAKLEAEMKAYEPWGRGGAGAPLRDDQGNLISDLKRMHRSNEEAYGNPEPRNRKAVTSVDWTRATPRAEDKDFSLHISSDNKVTPPSPAVSSFTRPSPHARGNVFSELPTQQQLREQERYKEGLKQQIEEKRRLEEDRRERLRLEEEKEERRLAEERAQLQRQFEEEQEKDRRKEVEQSAKNQEMIRQAEERRREAERSRKEEEEQANEALKQQYEQERQARLIQETRTNSPPIPTIQKRLGHRISPRPPSIESQRSTTASSVRSIPTPLSPPVPARKNQIRAAEEQQDVMEKLSFMRRHLRNEQQRLEGQLLESEREETQTPFKSRALPLGNVFDMARLRMQIPDKAAPSSTRALNKQIMQEFNQLKYRDSESREEVRQAYPEPPTDEASLEIQQQALLREQQRTLQHMHRARAVDYFDLSSPMKPVPHPRGVCVEEAERKSLLESESAFIDANGYSLPMTPRPDRTSARERRRRARRTERSSIPSLGSANSVQLDRVRELNQRRIGLLDDTSQRDRRSGDDEDDLWQQTPSPRPARCGSTTTVATEAWLRPGTTETLKKLMAGQRSSRRNPQRDEWDAPPIYHS